MEWTTDLAIVALSAVGAALGTMLTEYFGSRGRKEGEIDALRHNLDEVLRQLKESTLTVEQARATVTAQLEHDRTLFARYDSILTEGALRDAVDGELYSKRSTARFPRQLGELVELWRSEGGRFVDPRLQEALDTFASECRDLKEFIGRHFFQVDLAQASTDEGRPPLALYPDLKREDPDKWHPFADELDEICEQVGDAYSEYRRQIKTRLAI